MLHGDLDQVGQFFIFFTRDAKTKLNIYEIYDVMSVVWTFYVRSI